MGVHRPEIWDHPEHSLGLLAFGIVFLVLGIRGLVWRHGRGLVGQRCRCRITLWWGGLLRILKRGGVGRRLRLRPANRRGKEHDENQDGPSDSSQCVSPSLKIWVP